MPVSHKDGELPKFSSLIINAFDLDPFIVVWKKSIHNLKVFSALSEIMRKKEAKRWLG